MTKAKVKLIYNPRAGKKRKIMPFQANYTLEDIKRLFERYQIPVDYFPSTSVKDAIQLAKDSKKEGYEMVVAAGGDGTVATIAHGLINTDIILGVLTMGSVMNIARMLAIPRDLEMAIILIKIKKTRKIDVGQIIMLEGEKVVDPTYFIEQAGIGLDADYHYYLTNLLENLNIGNLGKLLKVVMPLFGPRIEVEIDGNIVEKKARMVLVSNGPYSGPGLKFAPDSKLNDHSLTVSIFHLSKLGLLKFILNLVFKRKAHTSKVKVLPAQIVRIRSKEEKMIHADARVYGKTPIEFKIVPSSLNVVTGFPEPGTSALDKRTALDV